VSATNPFKENDMTYYSITRHEVAYINDKGIRRVGIAYEVSEAGDTFKVLHKQGYFEYVTSAQIARAA
jgi:hypothetical protein